jgi:integrase
MRLRLVRAMEEQGRQNRFIQRIPADVRERAIGMTLRVPLAGEIVPFKVGATTQSIRLSLRTRDPGETKTRQAEVAAYVERVWQSLRADVSSLTKKQAVALAGEVYKRFTSALEDDPGAPEVWRKVIEANRAAFDGDFGMGALMIGASARKAAAMEERFGPLVDLALAWMGLRLDAQSRVMVLDEVARAMQEASEKIKRNADGDYRRDEVVARFPVWQAPQAKGQEAAPAGEVTITGLLKAWGEEASNAGKASHSTLRAYGHAIKKFVAFLGHDDAQKVTAQDVVRYKDARLAEINPRTGKPVSAKTVNDGDLTGLKTVFGWAVKNRKLATNPATGITVAVAEKPRLRSKGFTDAEANALLKHALHYKPGKAEFAKTTAAKRWVPWLMAFSGARVGEMVQLRKQDLRRERTIYMLHITPEAGTVKGRRYRDVPLHPDLVKMGFPKFVATSGEGYLFFTPTKKGGWRGPWQAVKNRLQEFVREVVTDKRVQPNHGWRHRFITQCRENCVDQELRRMITGHKGEGVDEAAYDDPAGLYREICKLPSYKVK